MRNKCNKIKVIKEYFDDETNHSIIIIKYNNEYIREYFTRDGDYIDSEIITDGEIRELTNN